MCLCGVFSAPGCSSWDVERRCGGTSCWHLEPGRAHVHHVSTTPAHRGSLGTGSDFQRLPHMLRVSHTVCVCVCSSHGGVWDAGWVGACPSWRMILGRLRRGSRLQSLTLESYTRMCLKVPLCSWRRFSAATPGEPSTSMSAWGSLTQKQHVQANVLGCCSTLHLTF